MTKDSINIEWLTKSSSMQKYIDEDKSIQLSGGRFYEVLAMNVLSDKYKVSINTDYIKNENAFKYFIKNHKPSINAEVYILDPYILASGKFDVSKKNIAIIHHIDEELGKNNVFGKVFLKRMISNLKKVDLVVVVSEFWKHYLENKGIKNIEIIYNSYDLNTFNFTQEQILKFQSKFNFDTNKPLVYLGKIGVGKGVEKALKYIDASKYNLVVTGKKMQESNIIVTYFFSEEEFPVFLSKCDVVLAMSTMQEGWNRIAHESLLVKTPVIGSGSGGMGELLSKSRQVIIDDWNNLNSKIDYCIENKDELGNQGYKYVNQFNLDYFSNRWNEVINKVL